ncbi:cell division protein FtsB [Catenovulum maritimum]|uniref:Cell division protein FtsB n=1 Tax=Catenovulum maritimum TaxID=1513271 RepID=A0A0J8GRE6_9ALTE|nr:cell division protein FtsB [Catenovulum maritimum]KMT65395.1 cell division protein FtsB [Catenovulum maritimum]
MKLFRLGLIIIFISLQYRLWFGENAYPEHLKMSDKVTKLNKENEQLATRNKVMMADIQDLKSGLEAIEERARNELGLIKSNETFYRIAPTDSK